MERITAAIKREGLFLVATGIYSAAAIIIFPYLRYYVDNPDTISYITIARKYYLHDYSNAVNGYWSPLISWILSVLFYISKDEITAFKLIQLPIGLFALYNFEKMARVMIHSVAIRIVLVVSAVFLILSYGLLNLTPDLLFLAIVLFYLRIVTEKEFYNHRHFGLIAGVLGILLYFAKSFGFLFFLSHFSALTLKIYFQTKEHAFRKHILGNFSQAIICFAAVSSIWIYLISQKYGHVTISENAGFNLSREVAAGPEEENELPVLMEGIFAPVNSTAVNAWEDPGLSVKVNPLHPFSIAGDLAIYKKVLARNLLTIYYFDFRRQFGMVFILLLFVFFFNKSRKKMLTDDYFFSLFYTVIIIYAGYSMILVHSRYIWICTLCLILLSAWIIEELNIKPKKLQAFFRVFVIFVLIGLAIKRPVKEILFTADKDISANELITSIMHPMETMRNTYARDRDFFRVRSGVKSMINPGTNIISLKSSGGDRDAYTQASIIALTADAKYLGGVPTDSALLYSTTRNFKADYLLTFSGDKNKVDSTQWVSEYSDDKLPLKIYRRNN